MAITKEQIFSAADELDRSGQNPTLSAVRKVVGGGSFTTISDAMTEWKARKSAKAAPDGEPLPDALMERLEVATRELWSTAVEHAAGRHQAERERMDEALRGLEASRNEAAELANHLAAELEVGKARNLELEAAEADARAEAADLRSQVTSAAEKLALANARVGEIEKRADDLNRELERVHTQNAELMKVIATKGTPQR
jgi:hypothetical protein